MKRLIAAIGGLALALIVGAVLVATGILSFNSVETERESRNSLIINAIERENQVVLLSLGVQGLAEESVQPKIFGRNVPWSGRTLYMQYNYRAKLGIDGGDVTIEQTGDNEFRVTIPEFILIGHDDIGFRVAVERNGVLSFVTPEIDQAKLVTELLSDDATAENINNNRDVLREQAAAFYTGIFKSVDPEITVTFDFTRAG